MLRIPFLASADVFWTVFQKTSGNGTGFSKEISQGPTRVSNCSPKNPELSHWEWRMANEWVTRGHRQHGDRVTRQEHN